MPFALLPRSEVDYRAIGLAPTTDHYEPDKVIYEVTLRRLWLWFTITKTLTLASDQYLDAPSAYSVFRARYWHLDGTPISARLHKIVAPGVLGAFERTKVAEEKAKIAAQLSHIQYDPAPEGRQETAP